MTPARRPRTTIARISIVFRETARFSFACTWSCAFTQPSVQQEVEGVAPRVLRPGWGPTMRNRPTLETELNACRIPGIALLVIATCNGFPEASQQVFERSRAGGDVLV